MYGKDRDSSTPQQVRGDKLDKIVEQKTHADAVGGSVVFSKAIDSVEIFNSADVAGVFTVNGFSITVPAGGGYRSELRGDRSATVSVSGSDSYEIRRLHP